MTELGDLVKSIGAPWLLPFFALLALLLAALRIGAEVSTNVEKALGPLGAYWTRKRDQRIAFATMQARVDEQARTIVARDVEITQLRSELTFLRDTRDMDGWRADLVRQVRNLSAQVTTLRRRNEMTDAYLAYDADYHRAQSLGATQEPHVSYLQFEERWVREHGPLVEEPPADSAGQA